jgi:hypothetical protein
LIDRTRPGDLGFIQRERVSKYGAVLVSGGYPVGGSAAVDVDAS